MSGFTVIVYCFFVPLHPFNVGSTSTVLVIAEAVVLDAVNNGVLPVPLAEPKPTPVLLFVHAYVDPDGVVENTDAATTSPLHGVRLVSVPNVGVGFMVILNVFAKPGHPSKVGVTDTVPSMSKPVAFAGAENAVISPVPLTGKPTLEFVFVHANVVPGVLLTNAAGATLSVAHLLIGAGVVKTGILLTLIVLPTLITLLQLPLSTFVKVIVLVAVIFDTVTSIVSEAGIVTGLAGVPTTPKYETLSPAVPVIVNVPVEPLHTSPLLVKVGAVGWDLKETVTGVAALSHVVVVFFATTL